MHFAGVNWYAIVIATIVGFAIGAVWYRVFARPWMAAAGVTAGMQAGILPYAVALGANFLIAFGLAGIVGHFGPGDQVNVRRALITGVALWLGFTITALATNYLFARRPYSLLAIDGGYWLVNMAVMGWIIGFMGLK
jgi:hypothetical protein